MLSATTEEVAYLLGFLTSGLLAGQLAHWLDQLVAFIRSR